MMKTTNSKIWFPAKTYGWGWGPPSCWQGWLVLSVYMVLAIIGGLSLPPDQHLPAFLAYMIVISTGLICICWLKGEKPRWRWGGK